MCCRDRRWRAGARFLVTSAGVALAALAATAAEAGIDEWTSGGPFGGPVRALAVDPIHRGTLYAGTHGGVFLSVDGGARWAPARDGLPRDARVGDLAIDPRVPATVYAAVGVHGVYKSTDGGAHWKGLLDEFVSILAIDPRTPGTLYAAGSEVFKSTDAGVHWRAVNDGLADIFVTTLAIDPQTPGTLYAGTSGGVFRSTDGGEHWSPVGVGSAPTSVFALAIDPQTPTTLYAGGEEDGVFGQSFVYKSTDGGEHWSRIPLPASSLVTELAIDPQTPTRLFAVAALHPFEGPLAVFRSVDGGDRWDAVHVGGVGELVIDPQVPATVYGAGTGVLKSTDGGDSWSAVNDGLANTRVSAVAVDPTAPDTLYAGVDGDGVFRSLDGGETWSAADENLVRAEFVEALVVDPVTPTTLYAVIATVIEDILFDLVFRSLDGGTHWGLIQEGLPFDASISSLVIDPQTPTTLYAATGFYGVFKTTDGGDHWFPAGEGLDDSVRALAIDPRAPSTLYAGGFEAVYRSTDGGASWEDLNAAGLPRNLSLTLLAIDPVAPGTVYAVAPFHLLRSTDGGSRWVRIGAGIRGEIETLAIDPKTPGTLYAGGSEGVFRSIDGGNEWTALDKGLAVIPVTSLAVAPTTPATVHAGTRGGGVFSIRPLGQTVLTLHDGRFTVEVDWRDFRGATGAGKVAVLPPGATGPPALRSRDSAVTEFFSADNWEMLLKVLDGRAFNGRFWVFLSAATNVEISTTVTDTSCGASRTYLNPPGRAAPAVTDVTAFPGCADSSPPSCVEGDGTLCLGEGGRFRVETTWRDFAGAAGPGRQASIPTSGLARSGDSGLFYFFSEDNWELLVKVLDGCAINDRFWVYAAATTDVEYTLTVTDTEADEVKTYTNPLGRAADAITDGDAFATCP